LAVVTIDGEEFTFQQEADDPCLITRSVRGKQMLRALAERLGGADRKP